MSVAQAALHVLAHALMINRDLAGLPPHTDSQLAGQGQISAYLEQVGVAQAALHVLAHALAALALVQSVE